MFVYFSGTRKEVLECGFQQNGSQIACIWIWWLERSVLNSSQSDSTQSHFLILRRMLTLTWSSLFIQMLLTVKLWYTNMEHSVASLEAKANVCCVKFNPKSRYHLAFGSAGKLLISVVLYLWFDKFSILSYINIESFVLQIIVYIITICVIINNLWQCSRVTGKLYRMQSLYRAPRLFPRTLLIVHV